MKRAVFLDRDGVLNRAFLRNGKPHPPASLAEFELLPGVPEACAALHQAGFLLIVVTNQPDVARGTQRLAEVEAMHQKLQHLLPLDGIRVCPHDDKDRCDCRKPSPGLLTRASIDWNIDLKRSFMVGDRWKDIAAGRNAGCGTILVGNGYSEPGTCTPDAAVESLEEAARWIIKVHLSGKEAK